MSPSTQPQKFRQSAKNLKTKSKKSAVVVMPKKEGGWRDVRSYLDDTEKKLVEFGHRVEGFSARLGNTAKAKTDELEDYYGNVHKWLSSQIDKVRAFEASTETWYDTALVQTHLAKMEASEMADDLVQRLDTLKSRVEHLISNKSNSETTSDLLKKFGDAFTSLKQKVVH